MIFSGYRGPVQPKIPLPDVSSKVLKKVSDFSFFFLYSYNHFYVLSVYRSRNIANTTRTTLVPPLGTRMSPTGQQISVNGTRSLSLLTKICFSRSSWLQIIFKSRHSCEPQGYYWHSAAPAHKFPSDFGCQTVVNRTKGKTPEELCNFFGIANEFTAEVCPVFVLPIVINT